MLQIQHYDFTEGLIHKLASSQWVILGNYLFLGVQVASICRGAERAVSINWAVIQVRILV